MKLSFSNIGFEDKDEAKVYELLQQSGFAGLEIAPSKFIGENPYNKSAEAAKKAEELKSRYGLCVPSMQSIWYGQTGNIFDAEDAARLTEYTKSAVEFAAAIGCKSLVFGCPKNRNIPQGETADGALTFFADISALAAAHGVRIALEANAAEYGTNFINTSAEAFAFAKRVPDLYVNYDLGTALMNGESFDVLKDAENIKILSHVHISEPFLAPVKPRAEHAQLAAILKQSGYDKFISIEMKTSAFDDVKAAVNAVAKEFI